MHRRTRLSTGIALVLLLSGWNAVPAPGVAPFLVEVVDDSTGRGVPLMELSTVHHVRWWTDNAGCAALLEPALMGVPTFLHVRGHGYEYPADGFGYRGVRVTPVPGGSVRIAVRRLNIAERLYRITGADLYRDSLLAGRAAPLAEPLLNAGVTGQDTVIATVYRGLIHWFWGDTDQVGYPLGNFGATGATSELPGRGGLSPSVGIDLRYFTNAAGAVAPMCPEPSEGLRWIESLIQLRDRDGRERLYARMAHHRDLGPALGWYLMVFNDDARRFEVVERWNWTEGHDAAHTFRTRSQDREFVHLYPNLRCPPTVEALRDPARLEAFTCVAGDGRWRDDATVDRDATGRVRYSWKAGADRLTPRRARMLVERGLLQPEESWLDLHDVVTGRRVAADRGSVFWNAHRRQWILIAAAGPGEIWLAEADTPVGPWAFARQVVAHQDYNFYNPTQHPFFDEAGGRRIYFEGTYTAAFSAAREKTPRHDYNQILYRLDLDDPRLNLPVPVYEVRPTAGLPRFRRREELTVEEWRSEPPVAFHVLRPDRPAPMGMVRLDRIEVAGQPTRWVTAPGGEGEAGARPLGWVRRGDDAAPLTGRLRVKPDGGIEIVEITGGGVEPSPAAESGLGTVDLRVWKHPASPGIRDAGTVADLPDAR